MNAKTACDHLMESDGAAAHGPRAVLWDWPLVAIIVLGLALLLFFSAGIWMPRPFPHG